MSGCGANVPLDDIVEQIVKNYIDKLVDRIKQDIDLSQYVKVDNGTANNITLKGGIVVDEKVKADLCAALHACIVSKIEDRVSKIKDVHVLGFHLDVAENKLCIDMNNGEKHRVSLAELEKRLTVGIIGGSVVFDGNKAKLVVVNPGGKTVDIDVTALKDTRSESGKVVDGTKIRFTRNDGTTFDVDISSAVSAASKMTGGTLINNTTLRLTFNDGSHIDIDLSSLKPSGGGTSGGGATVTGGYVTKSGSSYYIVLNKSDGSTVNIDATSLVGAGSGGTGGLPPGTSIGTPYRIVHVADQFYTTKKSDYDGKTILRGEFNGNQTITVSKPDTEEFVGGALTIRKTAGLPPTVLNLVCGAGVEISPVDITPIRRIGNTVTLVYVGDGKFDAFGETP